MHVAAAILRRGDEIVMIRQAAPGEEPFWSLPAGQVEDDELVTEGLAREVREETGLAVVDAGRLGFVVQIDNRRAEQLHQSFGPGVGYLATIWTFEVAEWGGTLGPRDPDGLVSEARLVPVSEAIGHLEQLEWQAVTVAYLRGEVEPGSLHLQRWHPDGRIETL